MAINDQFVRGALRVAGRHRYLLPMTVLTGIGIGAVASILSLADAVLIRPLDYPAPERLVGVSHVARDGPLPMPGVSTGLFLYYKSGNRTFADLAVYSPNRLYSLGRDRQVEQIKVALGSPNLLPLLGARLAIGRFSVADDFQIAQRTSAVISHQLWHRRYSRDEAIIGAEIEIDGWPSVVVVGVVQDSFRFPDSDTDIWLNWPQDTLPGRERAGLRALATKAVGRLKPEATLAEAAGDLNRLAANLPDRFPDVARAPFEAMGLTVIVTPLKDVLTEDVSVAIASVAAVSIILLLTIWTSVTSLTVIHTRQRRKELALHYALGATGRDMARSFIAEGVAFATVGGALSMWLVWLAASTGLGLDKFDVPRLEEFAIGSRVVILLGGLWLATLAWVTLLAVAGTRHVDLHREVVSCGHRTTDDRREHIWRWAVITCQIVLTTPLVIVAALMATSFVNLTKAPLGFRPDGLVVFTLKVPPTNVSGDYYQDVASVHSQVLGSLRGMRAVRAVEATTVMPLTSVPAYYGVQVAAVDEEIEASAFVSYATEGYFGIMGIPLISGRAFRDYDLHPDRPGVIVSTALAQALCGKDDCVGRHVRVPASSRYRASLVVGVVGDVPLDPLHEGVVPIVYLPHVYPPPAAKITGVVSDWIPDLQTYVVRADGPLNDVTTAIHSSVSNAGDRLVATQLREAETLVDDATGATRLTLILLLVSAGVAIFVGVCAVYSLVSAMALQRRQEIAIRIALGARNIDVIRTFMAKAVFALACALPFGALAGIALASEMATLLYETTGVGTALAASTMVLLSGTVMVSAYIPAYRASRRAVSTDLLR